MPRGETDRARIARELREQIRSGNLAPTTRIPSAAALAEQYGVHSRTAQFALSQLKAEGLITTHYGRGSFVAATLPEVTPEPTLAEAMGRISALEERMDAMERRQQ